jgi:hypothetical protein
LIQRRRHLPSGFSKTVSGARLVMNRVFGGSVMLAVLTVGLAAWAQSPMTPSRLNPPTPGSASWVEPPPRVEPPAAAGPAAAAVLAAKPETQAARETEQRPARPVRQSSRPSSDSMAARLNRQELNRIRSGSSGYYRGYRSWSGY